ncbi:hypothetical protein [Flagellimonas okinawensis]|uniref:Uncharacterized protein n=1 Tax=Flagellimonas okinawensis TaxID=3031324 RepID=A0ABT5XRE7_9FLAO|nr:hypothetical protein [[Muricauda] okinawensis]MDF0708380.1 hypothetical protein [[Muricauda] okinawensis]
MKIARVLHLILLVSYLGFAQNTEERDYYDVPFLLFKTDLDTVSYEQLDSVDFKSKRYFTKTSPTDVYWAKLDYSKYNSLISANKWALQIGCLNKAEIYFQGPNGVDSKTMGSFELNKVFTGEFYFNKDQLIDG